MMKYIIWGCGFRGQKIYDFLGEDRVECFIDTNEDKQKTGFNKKKVLSYMEYKKEDQYANSIVVISVLHYMQIVDLLEQDGNFLYLITADMPQEYRKWKSSDLLNLLPFSPDYTRRNVVVGLNLFSLVFLDEVLKQNKNSGICAANLEGERRKQFEKAIKRICITEKDIDWESDNLFWGMSNIMSCNKGYNIYDFSRQIDQYHNEKIGDIKQKYTGKRCFIVATGPSLTIDDLNTLYAHNELCMSMNKVYYCFQETRWRPNFYMVQDQMIISQNYEDINKLQVQHMYVGDQNDTWLDDRFERFHLIETDFEKKNQFFSDDVSWGCSEGGTVTFSCLQFAAYMGFTEIYLLGVDFSYNKIGTVGNHFYNKEDSKNFSFEPEMNLKSYQVAREYADAHGIKIYNATRGGKLEVFERVDFDSLFEED